MSNKTAHNIWETQGAAPEDLFSDTFLSGSLPIRSSWEERVGCLRSALFNRKNSMRLRPEDSFLACSNLITDSELIRFTLTLTPSLSPGERVKPSAGREHIGALIVITALWVIDVFNRRSMERKLTAHVPRVHPASSHICRDHQTLRVLRPSRRVCNSTKAIL